MLLRGVVVRVVVIAFLRDLPTRIVEHRADHPGAHLGQLLAGPLRGVPVGRPGADDEQDPIKAAKEGERYVVWMEFLVDQMRTSNYGFELRYTVFEPKTAKVVGNGYGVPQQPAGPISLPPIGSGRTDVYADWAGRDVARQVMKRLGWVI